MFFEDRLDAGVKLAGVFTDLSEDWSDWQLIGLARGGVITAAPIAHELGLSLDSLYLDDFDTSLGRYTMTGLEGRGLFFGRGKHGFLPGPLGIGLEDAPVSPHGLTQEKGFDEFYNNLLAKQDLYNDNRTLTIQEKVIVCDDGLASGQSAFTAIAALRQAGAREIVLAIPVVQAWADAKDYGFRLITWRVSKMKNPATGIFYFNFEDTADEDVILAVQSCQLVS